jgi:hypothetical protein
VRTEAHDISTFSGGPAQAVHYSIIWNSLEEIPASGNRRQNNSETTHPKAEATTAGAVPRFIWGNQSVDDPSHSRSPLYAASAAPIRAAPTSQIGTSSLANQRVWGRPRTAAPINVPTIDPRINCNDQANQFAFGFIHSSTLSHNATVSDGSQGLMAFDLTLHESAGSRSLDCLVECCPSLDSGQLFEIEKGCLLLSCHYQILWIINGVRPVALSDTIPMCKIPPPRSHATMSPGR